jgi:hypothetical protein
MLGKTTAVWQAASTANGGTGPPFTLVGGPKDYLSVSTSLSRFELRSLPEEAKNHSFRP